MRNFTKESLETDFVSVPNSQLHRICLSNANRSLIIKTITVESVYGRKSKRTLTIGNAIAITLKSKEGILAILGR